MELASEMRAVLERRRGSGLSLLAFAKREDLSFTDNGPLHAQALGDAPAADFPALGHQAARQF